MRSLSLLLCGVLSCAAMAQNLQFAFHGGERRFSFGAVGGVGVEHARFGLDVDGKTCWAEQASQATGTRTLTLRFDEAGVEWTIAAGPGEDGTSAVVSSTIRNIGKKPVRLGRCRLADLSDALAGLRLGEGAERSVMLVTTGWGNPNLVRTIRGGGKHHIARTVAQMYNPAAKSALLLSFVSFDRIHTEHEVWWDEERQRVASSSHCDFMGFALAPGAVIESE